MNNRETNWREHQRNIYTRPDAKLYLRPDPKLYLRHDAHRFLPPQADERKYSPYQPRMPAGNPAGGQWTSEGGEGSDTSQNTNPTLAGVRLPRIPQSKPPTPQEQNRIARELTRWGPGALASAIAEGASWLKEFGPVYYASFDPPKTLAELQSAVSDPRPGYDTHHIVERATAAEDGSENHLINAPENLVRIPRWKHWTLNSWYETPNEDTDRMTPRNYLRGKGLEERDRVGLKGLVAVGVLKP
jgi:hypothetical protein